MQSIIKHLKIMVSSVGASVIGVVEGLGKFFFFIGQVFFWMIRPPYRFKLILEQLYFIGNKSFFLIALTGAFSGMVMAIQTYFGFKLISVDSLVGPVVALTMAKELAPVFTGIVVAGRAGAAMAAQIGTMKVTEQVDALEVMGINAYQYLAIPRVVAGTIAVPMLSILYLLIGNMGSWLVGTKQLMIDEAIFFSKLGEFMFLEDVYQGIMKATVFGLLISLIGTYFGFQVDKGAEGVGKGTNMAVVWGMASVLVIDYFLTIFWERVIMVVVF